MFSIVIHTDVILNSNAQIRLFTGTYTEGTANGFFIFDLNRESGTFTLVSGNDAGQNPSYFCISKNNKFIYAANEVGEFQRSQRRRGNCPKL